MRIYSLLIRKRSREYIKKCFGKSATNGLHFFVRYDNMYCSDAQMSLLGIQANRSDGMQP